MRGKWAGDRGNVITAFGLMWPRQAWQHSKAPHRLVGKCLDQGFTTLVVDFSLHPGLYVLYADEKGAEPIYVGIAHQLDPRLWFHTRDHLKNEWCYFSWFTSGPVLDDDGHLDTRPVKQRKTLGIIEARIWHDFEALLYRAFYREISNKRNPYFGGSALNFKYQDPQT